MRAALYGMAFLAAGCGGAQHFDAAERATATSPRGDIAAEYEVGDPGDPTAEVKVWTGGAYESRVGGREMTVLEVIFHVENNDGAPVELANVILDSARASGTAFENLPPFRVDGNQIAPPRGEATLRAYFALPERYDPEDVDRFEVGWSLRHDEGTYAQRTPFRQTPDYDAYAAYYPYPYPFPFYYVP